MASTTHINLANIDQELMRLWDEEQGEKKIRSCLFNFILYASQQTHETYTQELIKTVISKFPCRVILILQDSLSQEERLQTSVSTHVIEEKDVQIFCEMIQIEVTKKLQERVPFIILPHIVPDLPVYLLWFQDPITDISILPHLEPFANRIIFNGEGTSSLNRFSELLLSLGSDFYHKLADLSWTALKGWQHLLKHTFNTPETMQHLLEAKYIRIGYQDSPQLAHPETKAFYLLSWITSCLGWKCKSMEAYEGNIRLIYRRSTDFVTFVLTPKSLPSLSPGSIVELEIESNVQQAHYAFKCSQNTRQVFVQFSDKSRCDLPYPVSLAGGKKGEEIIEDIFYPSNANHYVNMLQSLIQIPWRKE